MEKVALLYAMVLKKYDSDDSTYFTLNFPPIDSVNLMIIVFQIKL